MAAPVIDTANIATASSGTGGALTLPLPGGTANADDVYIACFEWGNQSLVFTPPSGFTQIRTTTGTQPSKWLGYSIGTPANTGADLSSGGRWTWTCIRITGADVTGPPIDVSAIEAAASAVTTTTSDPGLTTLGAERLVLHFYGIYTDDATGAAQSWTPDGATTQVVAHKSPSATARNMQTMVAQEVKTAAGAVPARTAGITLTGDALDATLAITPTSTSGAVAGDLIIERS
jgi:hypothetical protein